MSDNDEESELDKEKERNDDPIETINGLQKQIQNLTDQVANLNAKIQSMQQEKLSLIEITKSKENTLEKPISIDINAVEKTTNFTVNENDDEKKNESNSMHNCTSMVMKIILK